MLRLKGLDYRVDEPTRHLQFQATAKEITTLLGSIRGFIAALSQSNPGEGTHLRLVLSANELALLPFEMANAGISR